MDPENPQSQKDPSRKLLLEEIRKRAEEAEMKRLEDEEKTRLAKEAGLRQKQQTPAPFPVTATQPEEVSNRAATEQKILVLRERLVSALERGKLEKARELFTELNKIVPGDPSMEEYKSRLATLKEERSRQATRIISVQPRETADEKEQRETRRKKISDMLDAANTYYQQEKYDKALQYVNEVLNLDPNHAIGNALLGQIEKARQLEERIRLEEEERRTREKPPEHKAEPSERPVGSVRPTDFWGSSPVPKLESEYELIPEEKGPVGPPPLPVTTRIARRISQVRIPVKPLLGVSAAIVLAVAIWFLVDAIRSTVAPPKFSILVLPVTTSGDSSLDYLADGFTEDLISELSLLPEMRVIAPSTAYAFGASSARPEQVARALQTGFVLSWSMTRANDRIAVQAGFSDTSSGPVWSTGLQVPPRELPTLRSELLRSLCSAIGVNPVTADGRSLLGTVTGNEVAYDLYLHGRALLGNGTPFAPEEAIAQFEQALRLDPEFGEAYAALAWAHMMSYETSADMPPPQLAQALSNVQKALSRGLRTSETFRAWGLAEQCRGDYVKAIDRFEQSVAAAPSDAESQRRLAIAYAVTGHFDVAVKAAQRSVADDPGNITAHTVLGLLLQFKAMRNLENTDDYRAALRAYEDGLRLARDKSDYASAMYCDVLVYLQQSNRALEILLDRTARLRDSYVDFYKLGRVQQSAGRPIAEWRSSFVRARDILVAHLADEPDDASAEAYLALVYTRLGSFKDAINAITHAHQLAGNDTEVLYLAARMYALQKDNSHALEYLGKAITRRLSLASILDMDYFNLHSEPEFLAAIMR
jgi:tetratricopeptide (TPR) repeat protein